MRADRLEPWYPVVSTELKSAKLEKRAAEKEWLRNPITITKQIYNAAKRKIANIVFKARSTFYSDQINNARSSSKLFTICSKLLGRVKSSPLPTTHPVSELPDIFNKYFLQKINLIRHEIDQISLIPSIHFDQVETTSTFSYFHPVTDSELKKTILKSKPTSCPLDPIPTPLLIEVLDELLPTLTHIVNSSLSSGTFPSAFKTAIVKPLLKKSSLDPNILKNYRPVSNLAFISKIIEKIVLQQLLAYLNENQLISHSQSAYRPHHSTETALLKIANDILLTLDSGDASILTLLDLSAAFDTIDHMTLFKRLQITYGISGSALSWFSSYLSNRTQSVSINDSSSTEVNLSFGVPQGSVLGPVLFIMYTKPLSQLIISHSVESQSFADDTQLYQSVSPSTIVSSLSNLELCIRDIKSWMVQNKLKLNDDKTEALFIHSSSKQLSYPQPACISVCDTQIPFAHSAKNLGVSISDDMSVDSQVQTICNSAYCELRRIGTIRHLLSVHTAKILVCAFVLSKLDYCNSLLYGCPQHLIYKLQKVQNSAARLVLRVSRYHHVQPLLKSLHWLPIKARIDYKIATLCHSYFNGTAPSYIIDMLSPYTPPRQLRSSSDSRILCVPLARTKSFGERSFSFSAPSVWNSLPREIRHIHSLPSFKTALKTHLFKLHYNF